MANISMDGVGGCSYVTMNAKSSDALKAGMAVTITGANEVGFGQSTGSAVYGVVVRDKDERGLVAVQVSGFAEGVMTASDASITPGNAAVCNDRGELMTVGTVNEKAVRAVVTAVYDDPKHCTILL